jgi:hypothetical protein
MIARSQLRGLALCGGLVPASVGFELTRSIALGVIKRCVRNDKGNDEGKEGATERLDWRAAA